MTRLYIWWGHKKILTVPGQVTRAGYMTDLHDAFAGDTRRKPEMSAQIVDSAAAHFSLFFLHPP